MSDKELKLTATKSSFRLRGVVAGLGNENAYREGVVEKGKSKGKKYRSIRFAVKTSATNTVYVELFGMEQDQVMVFKREDKAKGIKGEQKRLDFAKRHQLPAGFDIIESSFEIEAADDGKLVKRALVRYDAVLYIKKYLKDGDSVYVSGAKEDSEYTNPQNGQTRTQTRYTIRTINKQTNAIDFEVEGFEEVAAFEQEIVFVSAETEGEKVFVTGRSIQYGDKWVDVQYVVDPQDADETKTAKAFAKHVKFGDFIKINGEIVNRVVAVEAEEELTDGIFGKKKAAGYNRTIRDYISELRIIGADEDTYEAKKYTDADFVIEEFIDNTPADNPFADSKEEEIGDEELPF